MYEQSAYIYGDHVKANDHQYTANRIWYPNGKTEREWYNGWLDEYSGCLSTVVVFPSYANGGTNITPYKSRSDALRRALKKFYEQVRDSENNLSVTLAEWQQVRRMSSAAEITKTVGLVYGFLSGAVYRQSVQYARMLNEYHSASGKRRRELRRRLPSKIRKCETGDQVFANTWLLMKYGWIPLLKELWDLAHFSSTFWFETKIKGRSTIREMVPASFQYDGSPPGRINRHWVMRGQYVAELQCVNPYAYDLQRITSLNPLGIAWEVTPFSFVIDWFIDIGGFLQDLETSLSLGLKWKTGYSTYHLTYVGAGYFLGSHKDSGGNTNTARGKVSCLDEVIYRDRKALSGFPLPYIPVWQPRLGWQRCTSGAALLLQRKQQLITKIHKILRGVRN